MSTADCIYLGLYTPEKAAAPFFDNRCELVYVIEVSKQFICTGQNWFVHIINCSDVTFFPSVKYVDYYIVDNSAGKYG